MLIPSTVAYTEDGKRLTVKAEFARGSFAVVFPPNRVLQSVILVHIPSETALVKLSGGIEVAKALIESLQRRRDWGHKDTLPRLMELQSELNWWAEQSQPPTAESLAAAVF